MSTIKYDGKEYQVTKLHEITWDDQKDTKLVVLRKAEKPVEVIAKCFGYGQAAIRSRMKILGLTPDPWTARQDRILKDNYQTKTLTELAKLVKVNHIYVAGRLEYLGLERPKSRK